MEYDIAYNGEKYTEYDFNSHTHVEYDTGFETLTAAKTISTHTLTWSTT